MPGTVAGDDFTLCAYGVNEQSLHRFGMLPILPFSGARYIWYTIDMHTHDNAANFISSMAPNPFRVSEHLRGQRFSSLVPDNVIRFINEHKEVAYVANEVLHANHDVAQE